MFCEFHFFQFTCFFAKACLMISWNLVYHIFEPHITWKLNFFPKLKKFPNASIRANMRFVKTRFCKANFGHFTSLRIFCKNMMGFELPSLTSIPFSSAITLSYLVIICCFYILCTPALVYLNPLITCDFSGQICSFPKSGKFGPNVTGIRTLTSPLEANGHLHYTTFTDDRYLGGIRHILSPWFSHKCVLK